MTEKKLILFLLVLTALTAVILTLAACANYGQTAGTSSTIASSDTNSASKNEVSIEGNTFRPDSITIKAGDTVTWINNDSYAHTVTGKNGEFDSGNMAAGEKFSFIFEKEGTYDYICGLHTFMTGKVVVTK